MTDSHDRRDYEAAQSSGPGLVVRRVLTIAIPIGLLVLGFMGFGGLMATAKKPPKNDEAPGAMAVEMALAETEQKAAIVESRGEVKSRTATDLSARASGQIIWVNPKLEAGAQVGAGERLIQIDTANYKLALESSEADAARAREALTRARTEAELAERDYRELGLPGEASDLALGRPQVATAEANVRVVETRIEEARLALARTAITAPYAGRVKARLVDTGDFVTMGMPVATMFSTDVAQIRVPLTDGDLYSLGLLPGFTPTAQKPAPIALVTADVAGTKASWTGKLVSVDASIDASTRQTYALIEVTDPFSKTTGAPLAPGVFANVSLQGKSATTLVKIPRGALKRGAEIYVVRADKTMEIRPVKPALTDAQSVWLADGLADGEKVIVSYVPSARTGLSVRDIRDPEPPKKVVAEDDDKKKKNDRKDKEG